MKVFIISGRSVAAPPPPDWRETLAQMLGAKPRRIGVWAELGVYGALRCMADAGETALPQNALLMLASRRGTYAATDIVLEQIRNDLPMPLAFLQTQPSQVLALLAAQMAWKGQACFVADPELKALLTLVSAQAGADGVLIGWVDEMNGGVTNWLRLRCCESDGRGFIPALSEDEIFSSKTNCFYIAGTTLFVRHEGQESIGEQDAG